MGTPRRTYQYLTAFTCMLSLTISGMHFAWPSPSLSQLTTNSSSFQVTSDEGSWIAIMVLISAIPSCFVIAFVTDIIGRKKSILLTFIPNFVGWVIIAFANSALELCIARFVVGIADGIAFTCIPLYVGEFADPKIRGFLGAGISVTWIFGILLINVIGSYLSIAVTAGVSSILPILFLATFVWMPESPYYLLMKNDVNGARSALKKFKGTEDVDVELSRLQEAVKNQNKKKESVLDLFKVKSNQRALGIMAIVRNSQQMSGVAAISFYTLSIFNEAGDFVSPLTATMIYVCVQCLMTAVCSVLIDRLGRRPLLIASLLGSSICLFVEGSYFYVKDFTSVDTSTFTFVPVVALVGYVIVFNLGAQPVPLLIVGELFPTNVKALASCISEVYYCAMAAIVSKVFQIVRDSFGTYLPFYVFAICCLVNFLFVVFCVPETKGKTLEEIQDSLGAGKKLDGDAHG